MTKNKQITKRFFFTDFKKLSTWVTSELESVTKLEKVKMVKLLISIAEGKEN